MQAEKEKESEAMGLSSHEKCSMTGKKVLRHIYVEAPGAKALETPPCLFFFYLGGYFLFLCCVFFFSSLVLPITLLRFCEAVCAVVQRSQFALWLGVLNGVFVALWVVL